MNPRVVLLLGSVLLIGPAIRAFDPLEKEPEPFPAGFENEKSTAAAKKKEPSLYVKKLAERLDTPVDSLSKLEKGGYGRAEMIRFALIAKKSKKSWDELYKERNLATPLRDMAKEAGLDYNEMFVRSEKMRDEIVAELGLDKVKLSTSTVKTGEKSE